ncbi:MAG: bifunctional 5,10-methylenetetrahydrofolate dehydrogenase/5,10-methenyltetrahydrofolate cyclohydrolase [Planctomycetes bacterium]|nr:bifunctional 5,10-methylenetetrahydrofolate dehydrogenase/5,10-methenyltetrahydrofolate cyclohydrolase [Planctomycetota bacterium]
MSTRIIDGKLIADEIGLQVQEAVNMLKNKGIVPHLAAVQVSQCDVSKMYIKRQRKLCETLGIRFSLRDFAGNISENELLEEIERLNSDKDITGIILQMPVPEHIQASRIQAEIVPEKDVEGITPANLGRLILNDYDIIPCTPAAVMRVIESENIDLKGKNVVIVGHSEIVGKPLSLLMLGKSATTTVCHIETKNLRNFTSNSDILISATGKAGLIDASMIKPGTVVIDVGINRVPVTDSNGKRILTKEGREKTRITGDVDFESVVNLASAITPVPGGVGAITSMILMLNITKSALLQL